VRETALTIWRDPHSDLGLFVITVILAVAVTSNYINIRTALSLGGYRRAALMGLSLLAILSVLSCIPSESSAPCFWRVQLVQELTCRLILSACLGLVGSILGWLLYRIRAGEQYPEKIEGSPPRPGRAAGVGPWL